MASLLENHFSSVDPRTIFFIVTVIRGIFALDSIGFKHDLVQDR